MAVNICLSQVFYNYNLAFHSEITLIRYEDAENKDLILAEEGESRYQNITVSVTCK